MSELPGVSIPPFAAGKFTEMNHVFAKDYKIDEEVGKGTYGVVYTTRHKKTNEEFAVKVIDRTKLSAKEDEATFREIGIMKDLMTVENVVRLVDTYITRATFHIVQVYARGGDVFDHISKWSKYSEMDARSMSFSLLKVISELHSRRLCHRDLKPQNLLLKNRQDTASILLADFGFTKYVPDEGLITKCGTPSFVAPEVVVREQYDTQADMWSVGCLIYMLISGSPPFLDKTHRGLFRKIRSSNFTFDDKRWKNVSLESKQVITSLLTVDPVERVTAEEALSMSWFTESDKNLSSRDLSGSIHELKKFNAKRDLQKALNLGSKAASKLAAKFNVDKIVDVLEETDKYVDSEDTLSESFCSGDPVQFRPSLNLSLRKKTKFSDVYKIMGNIQRGTSGIVKKCYSKIYDMEFAVKIIERNNKTDEQVLQEVAIMNHFDHENIVAIVDFYEEDDFYYIVMELMEGGDVFDRILALKHYTEKDARDLAKLLLEAVDEIHSNGIAHRDIKPHNIFLESQDSNCKIKVGDFGFAKRVHTPKSLTLRCGTPSYIAPEIVKNHPYDQSCDMWSVGVVIYVMLCGYAPFKEQKRSRMFERIKVGAYNFDPDDWSMISDEAKELVKGLMCINPEKRLTAKQALESRWISDVSEEFLSERNLRASVIRLKSRHHVLIKELRQTFKEFTRKTKIEIKKGKSRIDLHRMFGASKMQLVKTA